MRRCLTVLLCLLSAATLADSLYSSARFKPLIVDKRAYRVGDAVTVLVMENASAFTGADTQLDRGTDISGGVTTDAQDFNGGLQFGNGSTGSGRTSRSARLQAQITVTVTEVTANGDLLVAGNKSIEVNREEQRFKITGRIRREDIAADNTIQSQRLADVKIQFVGDGDISDKQKPGIISRVLDWLGVL